MTHNNPEERSVEEAELKQWALHVQQSGTNAEREFVAQLIVQKFHHQLQKVRQDWLREEIVKLKEVLTNKQYADISPFDHAEVVRVEALQTIIDRYQAELDQDVSR